MNRVLIAAVAATTLCAGPAVAQSSKFAAMWEEDSVRLAGAYREYYTDDGVPTSDITRNTGPGFEDVIATIKAPQGKELLIGVSGVADLLTFTEAKGKNKEGASTAEAMAGIRMFVAYEPADQASANVCRTGKMAAPGLVPLSMRKQTLTVNVDLDVVDAGDCDVLADDDPYLNEGECLANLLDIEGDVTVALGLDSAASHHFNFVATDLAQSTEYVVAACFVGTAFADVTAGDGSAMALVGIGSRMVTVQEVRAVQDAYIDME